MIPKLSREYDFTENISKLISFALSKGYSCSMKEISEGCHCRRLAVRLYIVENSGRQLVDAQELLIFGQYWQRLSNLNHWGGDFMPRDVHHFEMRPPLHL